MDRRKFLYKTTGFVAGSFLVNLVPFRLFAGQVIPEIAIVKSSDYYKATQKAIQDLGGMKRFIPVGASVGFLVNSDFTEPGTYTNPDIVLATMYLCWEAGARELVFLQPVKQEYWRRSGNYSNHSFLIDSSKEVRTNVFPAEYNIDDFVVMETIEGAKILKNIELVRKIREIDTFINLPILKHHGSTIVTGAMKNMMGLTTRKTNVTFHLGSGKRNDPDYLAQCIADLNLVRKPDLIVADATRFITANGPQGPGPMKQPDLVVVGTDSVAIDALASTYLDMQPGDVMTVVKAHEAGLGEMNLSNVKIMESTI